MNEKRPSNVFGVGPRSISELGEIEKRALKLIFFVHRQVRSLSKYPQRWVILSALIDIELHSECIAKKVEVDEPRL